MSKPGKKPQDHKQKKAVERLRDEAVALPGIAQMLGREVTLATRQGQVTVRVLADPLEWDAEVDTNLRERDYFAAFLGMLSTEDGEMLRRARPTVGSLLSALAELGQEGEPSLGESQAS